MNIVIMGCGRVGAALATMLDAEGHKVSILDVDPNSFVRLPSTFKGRAIIGDGTDEESLVRAGIGDADAFIAVTQGDNRNALASQIAKHIFHVQKVICRIYDPIRQEIYRDLGLETISPTKVISQLIREVIEG
ncbi:MAG: TrkA family potassium uptake protein [Chloroflexi bacterium]|nr:TrkA family potassium uptake protein [Chloroflexota bacterium]